MTWITCLHGEPCAVRCKLATDLTLRCKEPNAASRVKPLALYVTFRFLAGITVSTVIPVLDAIAYQMNVGKILKIPKSSCSFLYDVLAVVLGDSSRSKAKTCSIPERHDRPMALRVMTNTVLSGLAAIPVVAFSTVIMKYLGHTKILMLCMIFYGVRFLSYAFIYNPFHVLPVEILEAITTSLLWVVASVYCGKIAPDYLATDSAESSDKHYALEPLVRLPALRHVLSKKEEEDVVEIAKFEAFTPLSMTFSGRSGNSSLRSDQTSARGDSLRRAISQ
ncbi:hypothetical protein BV898_10952 [Hypsibius exemplaris]|uniref:Major facilitator superfamily associated domain-containing protein n=1 Tax=Hypsibius exemplaris TaxID=2072580 RepID=A0A1W0WHW1_HYPEX|nr:hypothetical protein BV898_10952 [Hypsibius exemplaris]